MSDLAERLRQIERNSSPDLWEEINRRSEELPPAKRRGLGHLVAAGLVAVLISGAALAFLVYAFRSGDDRGGLATFDGSSGYTLLVSSSGPSGDQALLTGTLTTHSGCVAVGEPASSVYVVWPAGYSLAQVGEDVWLVDDSGNHVARIGDKVQMGGGITNLAHAEPKVQGGIPPSCETDGPDAYWLAGTPELVEAGSPSAEAQPVHIAGVPFDVCRPMSIQGRFGDGLDTLWVFERAPEQGCEGYEGFQYLGVGTSDSVAGLSNEIHDVGQTVTSLWPYAAFDINRDGVDEIAVGISGSQSRSRVSIILFRLAPLPGPTDRVGVEGVTLDCASAITCAEPLQSIDLGDYQDVHRGADCAPYGTQSKGITLWSAEAGLLKARLWLLEGPVLRATTETFERTGEASVSLPDGTTELCGQPVHWPSAFTNYPPEDITP